MMQAAGELRLVGRLGEILMGKCAISISVSFRAGDSDFPCSVDPEESNLS